MQWLLTAARSLTSSSVLQQLVHKQATVLCSMAPHLPTARWLHTSAPAGPLSAALQQLSLTRLRGTPCAASPRHDNVKTLSTTAAGTMDQHAPSTPYHTHHSPCTKQVTANQPCPTSQWLLQKQAQGQARGKQRQQRCVCVFFCHSFAIVLCCTCLSPPLGIASDLIGLTDAGVVSSDDEEAPELVRQCSGFMPSILIMYCHICGGFCLVVEFFACAAPFQTCTPAVHCHSLLQAEIMNAVIKVYCVHTEPNYSLPWQRKRQYSSTSSGFIVSGNAGQRWILTNAHSVEYHSQVHGVLWCFGGGHAVVLYVSNAN